MTMRPVPNMERFLAKVDIKDEHWFWLASTNGRGYGQFWDNELGTIILAHIWSYKTFVGPIPVGHDIHHECEFRHCVRPDCLKILSRSDHNYTKHFPNSYKTHCSQGHRFDSVNIYHYNGSRYCRICHNERNLARYYRNKANLDIVGFRRP